MIEKRFPDTCECVDCHRVGTRKNAILSFHHELGSGYRCPTCWIAFCQEVERRQIARLLQDGVQKREEARQRTLTSMNRYFQARHAAPSVETPQGTLL